MSNRSDLWVSLKLKTDRSGQLENSQFGKRWIGVALSLVLLTGLSIFGKAYNRQKPQRASKTAEAKEMQAARLQILQRELPRLADSALAIKNLELRIETLATLADLLWSHDAAGARQLFQKSYDLLRSIQPANDQSQTKSDDASLTLPRSKLIALYLRFFSRLAKHDTEWKEQLLKSAPEFLSTPGLARNLDLHTAHLLLRERDAKAFDFIQSGISQPASGLADTMQVVDLLMRFRQLDANKADQLFIQVMHNLESQTITSTDDLFTIGNYLFTGRPPSLTPEDTVIISPVFVGTVAFHADISYDRPGISPDTVDHYLRSSASILTRQVDSESMLLQNRAAAFLLLPKSRRFAPDLVPILTNLSTGIDTRRTNSVEARQIAPEPSRRQTLESVLETLDAIKDPVKRDEYCLRMIWSFYLAADFKSAAVLTNRTSSPEIRDRLSTLISIGEAINSLQKGDINTARLQTQRLPPSKERSYLWLAIAARLIEKSDVQAGRIAIDSGLADARKTEGSSRVFLLLSGSELTFRIDFAAGLNILSEALNVINALDSDSSDPLRFDRFVRLKIGSQTATFPTDINNFKAGTVVGAFKVPLSKDPDGTINLILQLKNEYVRSSAIIAFASELTS
jgi:hypothetical protein